MASRGWAGLIVAAVMVFGACGPDQPAAVTTPAGQADFIRLDTPQGIVGVRPAAGAGERAEVVYRAGAAVASPSGDVLFRSEAAGEGFTEVVGIDGLTGADQSRHRVEGDLEVRAVGARGNFVVLASRRPAGAGNAYTPVPRDRSLIAVLDARDGSVIRHDLAGNFEPEALSMDGEAVFVVEYTPPMAPDRYRVRELNVPNGVVGDVFSPDKELQEEMQGNARRQVASVDGRRLYTLYTLEVQGTREAFVHVLDLANRWAHCVDLPVSLGVAPEQALALALDPTGNRLFVLDAQAQQVAEVNTTDLTVAGISPLPASLRWSETSPLYAATRDGTLYAAAGGEVAVVGSGDALLQLGTGTVAEGVTVAGDGTYVWSAGALWRLGTGGEQLTRQTLPGPG